MEKKLRFVMFLLLVALASGQTWAKETVRVPSSYTSTMISAVPVDCSYGAQGYHSQMIYPQSLLQEVKLPKDAIITAITFSTYKNEYLLEPGEDTENNPLTIKLGQPTDAHLSGFVNTGLTTVSTSGNIWSGTTSVTLEFDVDKAYRYDGGNLLIDLSWAPKANGYHKEDPTVYWTGFAAQQAARRAVFNDQGKETDSKQIDNLPIIDITYETKMPYVAEVSATSLNFGSTLVGSPCGKSVALKNTGARNFTYTISGLDAPFSTTVTEGTLAAGAEDLVIPVTFAPTAVGDYEDDLVINFASETRLKPITVHVKGKSSDAVCDGTDDNEFMPINGWCYNYKQINQMIYPASYLAAIGDKSIASITFYSTKANIFHGGKYNVSVGLTNQSTFSGPTRITGLQTVAADLVAEAGKTELTINFAQPFAYEAGKNLVVEFEVTEPGTNDTPWTERTYFYGENQSGDVSFFSWIDKLGNTAQAMTSKFLPKMKIKESGTAGNSYLDLANYATIDAAGATVGSMKTIYKYTEKNGQAWLTLSCYGAMAVDANQNWFETSSMKSYPDQWNATDVFKGNNAYFGSNHSFSLYGTGTQTFYVTNCSRVKAYVEGNDYTTTNATLTIYECSRNADDTLTPAAEATDTKQGRDGVITSVEIDPTKIYKVVLTGGGDFPSLLEIGFQTPLIIEGKLGDVNGDGYVDISDVVALVNIILSDGTDENSSADVYGESLDDISDVVALVNFILSDATIDKVVTNVGIGY